METPKPAMSKKQETRSTTHTAKETRRAPVTASTTTRKTPTAENASSLMETKDFELKLVTKVKLVEPIKNPNTIKTSKNLRSLHKTVKI